MNERATAIEVRGLTKSFGGTRVLTGRENLALVARLRHLANPGRIADALLARFSLSDVGGRRVATYSGGMRRRLDIAMSLIGSPPVIFLDEPTTGLDPEARREVWRSVQELADAGTTVLLTTQQLEEAEHGLRRAETAPGGAGLDRLDEARALGPVSPVIRDRRSARSRRHWRVPVPGLSTNRRRRLERL